MFLMYLLVLCLASLGSGGRLQARFVATESRPDCRRKFPTADPVGSDAPSTAIRSDQGGLADAASQLFSSFAALLLAFDSARAFAPRTLVRLSRIARRPEDCTARFTRIPVHRPLRQTPSRAMVTMGNAQTDVPPPEACADFCVDPVAFLLGVETVKEDIKNILRKEPDWSGFSDSTELQEPSGARVGLPALKSLLVIVRRFRRSFVSSEEVNIRERMFKVNAGTGDRLVMKVNGDFQLNIGGLPFPLPQISIPLDVRGSCTVYFNDVGLVTDVVVDSWSFNGKPIDLPQLENPDSAILSPADTVTLLQWTQKTLFS